MQVARGSVIAPRAWAMTCIPLAALHRLSFRLSTLHAGILSLHPVAFWTAAEARACSRRL